MDAHKLRELVDDHASRAAVSAAELAEAFLERAADHDRFGAMLCLTPDSAIADAALVDSARQAGHRLPLDGMPIVVKDNLDVAGLPTTAAARFRSDHIPRCDAVAVRALRRAGGVIIGKAAMHELAFGVTSQNEWSASTANPWDITRIPGGSSGGSAAAVAADLCVGAIGTDTGGSIRVPAALTGVTGLRPAEGTVSDKGMFHTCPGLDAVGPLARDARDLRRLHAVLTGGAPWGRESDRPDVDRSVSELPLKIGVLAMESCSPDVAGCASAALDVFDRLGAVLVPLDGPDLHAVSADMAVEIRVRAYRQFARQLETSPEMFGADVRERLLLGSRVTDSELVAHRDRLALWRRQLIALLDSVDIIALPTVEIEAPPIDGIEMRGATERLTALTCPWSLIGAVAVSIPCGLTAASLPVGLQLVAPRSRSDDVLDAAIAYQAVTDFHRLRSPLLARS